MITIQIAERPTTLYHTVSGHVWGREVVRGLVLQPRNGREEAVRAAIEAAGGRDTSDSHVLEWLVGHDRFSFPHDYVVEDKDVLDRIWGAVENNCRTRGGVRLALLDADRASVAHTFPSRVWTWREAEDVGARIDLPVAGHTPRVWHYGWNGASLIGARAHWPSGRSWEVIT